MTIDRRIANLITAYNENMRLNSEMMLEYNRNMGRIIQLLEAAATAPPTPSETMATALLQLLNNSTHTHTGLSHSDVEDATQSVVYASDDFNETHCPITHEEFQDGETVCQIRHCSHIFKRPALMRWFDTHTTCPVCRHELQNETPVADVSGVFVFDIPLRR
jgi:hypothetical protein